MAGVADNAEGDDGGSIVELEILTARKVDGAETLGEALSIGLGLALCLSRITCATAGCLDSRVRGRNGKRFQSQNGIFCGWGVVRTGSGQFRAIPGEWAVTYSRRSSVASCTF